MQNTNADQDQIDGKLKLLKTMGKEAREQSCFATVSDNPLAHAFKKKTVVHAGMGGAPVPREDIPDLWASLANIPRFGKTLAYIHIPFCETHCLYCGFYTNPATGDFSRVYTDALIREIQQKSELPACQNGPVHAVYLGGGTPTALDGSDLKRLLIAVGKHLPLANDCEITVEGRVLNMDQEKIEACLEGGANRFSIGVQTFDTDIRQKLGRVADRETILSTLKSLKNTDNAAVIIDLIFGLPGQGMEKWEDDIRTYLDLKLDGVDLYQLILYKNGLLEKQIKNGKLAPMADTPEKSTLFARGVEMMQNVRYRRLSISHWGRTTRERNMYNLLMKSGVHCLAYGSGAGGTLHGHTYFIDGKLKNYLANEVMDKKISMMLYLSPHGRLARAISGELELGRIDFQSLGKNLDLDLNKIYAPLLEQWETAGLIRQNQDWVELTLAGEFWQTNLAQGLMDYFKSNSGEVGRGDS